MNILHGIIPYLVTPFDNDKSCVQEDALKELVEHCIQQGVHGVCPLGSNGEFSFLSFEQKKTVVQATVEQTKGRVPVVAAVSAYSTQEMLEQCEAFIRLGADSLILILQKMFPLNEKELFNHYQKICQSFPDTSMGVYTNPSVLNYDLSLDLLSEISHLDNMQYIKDATGNTSRLLSMINLFGDRMSIFSASAHIPINVFQLGGKGWMAGPACLAPKEIVKLYELSMQKRWDEALILQKKLWPLNQIFLRYSLAKCTKYALSLQGFPVGEAIWPQLPLSDEEKKGIKQALISAGALN